MGQTSDNHFDGRGTGVDPTAARRVRSVSLGSPALGSTTAVMAAFTDNGKYHRFFNGNVWTCPDGQPQYITATAGGTAADVKAVQVIVIGTDAADAPLTESLPAFTVNAVGTVTSVAKFKTITSIEVPAHDGTGATTSIGYYGAAVDAILAAFTDVAANAVFVTTTITNPAVTRNITGTTGGTNTDVKAVSVVITGTDANDEVLTETIAPFTVNTNETQLGLKAFKTVRTIDIPVHDGTGATTAIGHGSKLGIGYKLARNSVLRAFLAGVLEGTAPTVAVSSTVLASNTAVLNSALNGTAVVLDLY